MSLAQLALHVATIPGLVAQLLAQDGLDANTVKFEQAPAKSAAELPPALDESVRTARGILGDLDDRRATATWRFTRGSQEIFALPRAALIRTLLLNHWYHHRGQLSVYLRLLGVPLPAVYGPTADENPFPA